MGAGISADGACSDDSYLPAHASLRHFLRVEDSPLGGHTGIARATVAENLVLARDDVPAVVDWAKEKKALAAFLSRMPFKVPLDAKVSDISAGERQKCEILKQLYLKRRFLILDEPTSVLTPGEADEVLGMLRDMVVAATSPS